MAIPKTSLPRNESRVLDGLNPEQQQAVRAAEGPVLVIAGAGTGKTRVIAHRIAHLLETHPELTPANLLAMTFSRKAAQEMLERVERLLGGYADELGVFTFHGFCHRFLRDHAVELGLPIRFRLLDRVESWIFFREMLAEFQLAQHWNLADPADCIDGFLRFISRAKDELVSPEEFAAYAKGLADSQQRSRAEEVARVYRLYQKRMRSEGILDFGDLVVETLRALKEQPALLDRLRAQYRFILVDEFQDTNVSQIALLGLLAEEASNLCVVGDDDQAIYRFRGASFASFLLMKELFPSVKTVRLTRTYRSSQRILSVAERLIRHNEPDRYDPEKHLWTENMEGAPVQVEVCHDERHETQKVIETIRVLHESQPVDQRRFDRIAVLYRAHAHRDRLVEALRAAGIPFSIQGGTALFEQEEIKDLIAFLRVLHDPSDSIHLFRLLGHSMWGISAEELMTLSRTAKERRVPLIDCLNTASVLPLSDAAKGAVSQLLKDLSRMHQASARGGVDALAPRVAEQTALRMLFYGDRMSLLGRFLQFTYRYAQTHPESSDLKSFLRYLDFYRLAGGDPADEEENVVGDQVRLMTIHQAKGLEFDWVILLSMVQGRFPARGRPEVIPFPVELIKESLPKGDYHLQEERRLCYVACTRARQGLFLMTQERAYHRLSIFVREMIENAPAQQIRKQESQPVSGTPLPVFSPPAAIQWSVEREIFQLLQQVRVLEPGDETGFRGAMDRVADLAARLRRDRNVPATSSGPAAFPMPDKFSYTQLETYRYCPRKYQYSYIYQIPIRPTPQMNFGIDLHSALESFFTKVIEGRVLPLQELIDAFRAAHSDGRYGEPFQEQEYRRLGAELLTVFYKKHEGAFAAPLFVEKPFSLALGGASVRGVIDRVDSLPGGGVEVIDYKSGKPKQEADADEQLQLRLYALACKEVFQVEPRRVSFYFLRNNEKLSFEQKPEALDQVKEKIAGMVQEIRSGDFTPAPSLMKCRRCDFKNLCPASMA